VGFTSDCFFYIYLVSGVSDAGLIFFHQHPCQRSKDVDGSMNVPFSLRAALFYAFHPHVQISIYVLFPIFIFIECSLDAPFGSSDT